MSFSRSFLKFTRLAHLYFGVFIAPALLFFAFTGALQTFSLHETTRSSSYKPPAWVASLAQLHKKQTTVVPVRKLPPPEKAADKTAPTQTPVASGVQPAAPTPPPQTHNLLPMKLFFLAVSIGLFLSTLSGLYMSYKFANNKVAITALLIAGTVLPVILTKV